MRIRALTILALVVHAAGARAGTVDAWFRPNVAGADDVPVIEALIAGAPDAPADAVVLVDGSARPPTEIHATRVAALPSGTATIAIALVVSGMELWIGNDQEVPALPADDPSVQRGALIALRDAIDRSHLNTAGPPGSTAVIVTYADRAVVRAPAAPLAELAGSALGTQRDYFQTTGIELVQGITLAIGELERARAARRVLIVIGDGNDTNNDAAKVGLAFLRKRAGRAGIETFAIVYRSAVSEPGDVVGIMIPRVTRIAAADSFAAALAQIAADLDQRTTATVVGYRPDRPSLVWDGAVHELHLRVGDDETPPVAVLLPRWQPPAPERRGPWLLLGGAGAVIVLAVGARLLQLRRAA